MLPSRKRVLKDSTNQESSKRPKSYGSTSCSQQSQADANDACGYSSRIPPPTFRIVANCENTQIPAAPTISSPNSLFLDLMDVPSTNESCLTRANPPKLPHLSSTNHKPAPKLDIQDQVDDLTRARRVLECELDAQRRHLAKTNQEIRIAREAVKERKTEFDSISVQCVGRVERYEQEGRVANENHKTRLDDQFRHFSSECTSLLAEAVSYNDPGFDNNFEALLLRKEELLLELQSQREISQRKFDNEKKNQEDLFCKKTSILKQRVSILREEEARKLCQDNASTERISAIETELRHQREKNVRLKTGIQEIRESDTNYPAMVADLRAALTHHDAEIAKVDLVKSNWQAKVEKATSQVTDAKQRLKTKRGHIASLDNSIMNLQNVIRVYVIDPNSTSDSTLNCGGVSYSFNKVTSSFSFDLVTTLLDEVNRGEDIVIGFWQSQLLDDSITSRMIEILDQKHTPVCVTMSRQHWATLHSVSDIEIHFPEGTRHVYLFSTSSISDELIYDGLVQAKSLIIAQIDDIDLERQAVLTRLEEIHAVPLKKT
ncbi:hypothetical protein DICA3_D05996 [Diutina catenulata]